MVSKMLRTVIFFGLSILVFEPSASAQWGLYLQGSLVTAGRPHDMVVSGNYAYLGDWGAGFTVINISNPSTPQQVYNYNTVGYANSVFLHDTLALVADWSHGMVIFDISNPASPVRLSGLETPGAAYNIYAIGDYAYIADFNGDLAVADISDPENPAYITADSLPGLGTGICGAGDYIYVVSYPQGIQTFDITDPSSPVLIGSYNSPGTAVNISISDTLLFLSDGDAGVVILSISNPANPAQQTLIPTPVYANDAAAVDTILYVADDSAGVTAYSINDILSPYELANYDSPGIPKGIYASGMNVFLGDFYSFMILIHSDTPTGIGEEDLSKPSSFSINSISPNPFNPQAEISFNVSRAGILSLDVFDISGRLVENIFNNAMEPGAFRVVWDGAGYPTGVYFFRLSGDGYSSVKKATLLK